jgi:hypothetical protein
MITYIIYSHTSYLDVLKIQTEYLKGYPNKILMINKMVNQPEWFSNYKDIIFYDDTLPYASRLLSLKQLDVDYILITQDMDIVIEKDDTAIENILNLMIEECIDRVDLQWRDIDSTGNELNPHTRRIELDNFTLIKQENTKGHMFNLNPSIWKVSSLLDVMEEFKNEGYRTIEEVTQDYCLKFDIYKPSCDVHFDCGYMQCNEIYQFLHITRGGKWLAQSGNGRRLDNKFKEEYNNIINRFNLKNSKRQFRSDGNRIGHPFFKMNK